MPQKYHKLSKKDQKLKPPLEYQFIKLSALGLVAFLITLLATSALAPVQPSSATGQILTSLQSTGDAISLSSSANNINLSLATTATGAVRTAMDTVTVTSDLNGYQLYLSTYDNNNALIRENTDGATTTDIIPATSTTDILNPTNLSNDTWGFATLAPNSGTGSEDVVTNGFDSEYKLGDNSEINNKFIAVPTKGNDILIAKRSTAATAVPTNIYYGVRATTAKPSGLYQNTVVYTAISDTSTSRMASISPSRTNIIQGGETLTVTTTNTLDLSSISSTEVTIGGSACTNPTPVKSDNGAGAYVNITCTSPSLSTGWHEVIVNINTINGTTETYVVNPGIEYYLDQDQTNVATYMQDFTISDCAQLTTNTTIILQDKRDNNVYDVSKLIDGNCWMSSNLRLGTPSQDLTLTSADTDTSTTFTIPATSVQTEPGTRWDDPIDSTQVYQQDRTYGNLYNYYTATTGTGTTDITSGTAAASICPKGWKLPGSTSGNGSYRNLIYVKAGFTTGSPLLAAPYNFVYSGSYNGNTLSYGDQGSMGRYWTNAIASENHANYLYIGQTGQITYGPNYMYLGFSVRCVFHNTMQSFNATSCANLETAKTITLVDVRDLNIYTAAKLPDGNCWMTSNLMLGNTIINSGSITIDSTNSQVASGTSFQISSGNVMASSKTNNWTTNDYDTLHIYARPAEETDDNDNPYGNLYNFYTATAKSGTQSLASGDTKYSICPKGWKLPPRSGNLSYINLFQTPTSESGLGITVAAGTNTSIFGGVSTTIAKPPYSFPLSGRWSSSGLEGIDAWGIYWLGTVQSDAYAYHLYFKSDGTFRLRDDGYYKYYGFAVRCVYDK